MTLRRPLVIIEGAVQELAASDSLPVDVQGGFASTYLFCDDVIFAGTTPPWHELERQSDGGTAASHTVTTGNNTYVEMDRYVTSALGTTLIPEGNWSFILYCKTDNRTRLMQIKADVYRVNSAGAIVGGVLGTAESTIIDSITPVGYPASCFIAEKTGWAPTDRIGVVISGRRVTNNGTLTYYHDHDNGWGSSMEAPLVLLHNQMAGLNDGDYRHLTATQYTPVAAIAALAPTDSNFMVGNGSTWVAESGATARTSLGLGTGDSPQFTAIELGAASDTTLARSAAGKMTIEGVEVTTTSNTQTLSNKTLTDPALIGTILEDIYTISDGAAFEIDPGNGSIQLITLGANRTPKATNFAAGESVTLMVLDGTAYTLTWTDTTFGTSGVVWVGGTAPTLDTTKYTVIELWKVSSQVYGALVGAA